MDYRFLVLGILLGLTAWLNGAEQKRQRELEIKKEKDQNGFLLAAFKGDAKKVDDYIKQGVNVNTQDVQGKTAAHLAALGACSKKSGQYAHVIKSLVLAKADMTIKDHHNKTALEKVQEIRSPRLRAAFKPSRNKSAPNVSIPKDFNETKED